MIINLRNRLLNKVIFLFTGILIIIGIAGVVIWTHYKSIFYNNINSSLNWGKKHIISSIDTEINLIRATYIKIFENSKLFEIIRDDISDKSKINNYLLRELAENNLDFIYILGGNKKILFRTGKIIDIDKLFSRINKNEINLFFNNSKFITCKNADIYINSENTEKVHIVIGRIFSNKIFYDLKNINNLDFILFDSRNSILKNQFTTVYDNYGNMLQPGIVEISENDINITELNISGVKFHCLTYPIVFFENKKYGMTLLKEDLSQLHNTRLYLILLYAGIFIVFLFILFFVKVNIISPIKELLFSIRKSSNQIEKNKPIEKITVKSRDELFELADSYNDMALTLGQSFSKVKYLQNYLMNIIESLPSSLIAINFDGKITHWNHSAVILTGISKNSALDHYVWEVIPEIGLKKSVLRDLIENRSHKEFHKSTVLKNEKRDIHILIFSLIANGIEGCVISIDDVTDLKSKEEQLRQAQKMEAVGTLAGGIAHDFNNILSGIVGVISIITYKLNKEEDIDKSLLKEYLEIMEESGKRAGDIVQRLLTLSKQQNTNHEPVNLTEVISNIENICKNSFDKRIEIKKFNTENNLYIYADFTQIEQILLNISINALHAMTIMKPEEQQNGGELTFRLFEHVSKEEIGKYTNSIDEKEYLCIAISDTGVGMDKETSKQIFEPFFTKKDVESGTGLGLTMVYNIVTQFSGFIDLESTPGIGTTFKIFFPKYEFHIKNVKAGSKKVLKKGSGSILVIDDELVLRELATNMLSQCGYKVFTAKDGIDGIEKYKQHADEISAVILDMVMPKLNGKDTFIKLKELNPDIKVILASGFTRDKRVENVLDLGVIDFIQKPYTIYELTDLLYRILNEGG